MKKQAVQAALTPLLTNSRGYCRLAKQALVFLLPCEASIGVTAALRSKHWCYCCLAKQAL